MAGHGSKSRRWERWRRAHSRKDDKPDELEPRPVYFIGPCTCKHAEEIHGTFGCEVEDCDCEAGWYE